MPMLKSILSPWRLLIASTLLLCGCAINPVTGETQLMLLTEQDERRLGQETDQSVLEQYGSYEDARLQNYLSGIGVPMARLSHRPALDWQFKVMDSPVVNAFAAPGGYIYVTRGLLAAVNNEAELAGILGHEIGHVTARHSAQQYSNMMLANIGVEMGRLVAGDYGDVIGSLLEAGTGLLFLKFSRDDEREADALGVEYASRAGFDAGRMADFFTTLKRMESLEGEGGSRLPEFFSTHPNPVNREATVRQQAADWQARLPQQRFRVDRNGYLQQIDGLVYGEDPRQGYRQEDWYYLPQHRVQYQIPANWSFEREGARAQMVAADGKALVLVSLGDKGSLDEAAGSFVETSGAQVQQASKLMVSGMPSLKMLSVLQEGAKRAIVQSQFFERDGNVFVFHGLCSEADYPTYQNLLVGPAQSFRVMTERDKLNRQPQRIAIRTVSSPTTLDRLLQAQRVDRDLWEKTAWLNGMTLNQGLPAGERIKIIQ